MTEPCTWHFVPDDTWFFREARPQGAVGAAELNSRFPPPARTVAGAARTLMGEAAGVRWRAFQQGDGSAHELADLDLIQEIGHGAKSGRFHLTGPWVAEAGEPLFPAPAFLLAKEKSGSRKDLARLRLGKPAQTDLGFVALPEVDEPGYKPLADAWLTRSGLEAVLSGTTPPPDTIRKPADLYAEEPRLGIARSNATRTVREGMLYQTRHLRPKGDVGLVASVAGVAERLQPEGGAVRFGGEGRRAMVQVSAGVPDLPAPPRSETGNEGILLTLLTDADLGEAWLPDGFVATEERGVHVWKGAIAGVDLTIHGAALGKARREGGWDLVEHRPRAVRSLTPAGSAWFAVPNDGHTLAEALEKLHGTRIGAEPELGRGQLAAGLWPETEFPPDSV